MGSRKRKPLKDISDEAETSRGAKESRYAEFSIDRRAGTVNKLILENFMCHSLLEVKFDNNIAFINGKNGSGKSAILTALIVGLGGKATITNRGTNMKGFVKAGKTSGKVHIELCNEGPMAYRPSEYGNMITIIRQFSANGGGSYKIKSASGDVISTSSKEIQNIASSLNIQVSNPICVLNQDTSRNFLSSNDPKNKFTLFMKATNLETLDTEYKRMQANKKDSISSMNEKQSSFKKLKDEVKRIKIKIDNKKAIFSLRDRKDSLHTEVVWAKVRDLEDDQKNIQQNLDSMQKKLNEYKTNSDKRQDRLKLNKDRQKLLEDQVNEVKKQIDVQKRPQIDLNTQKEELMRNMSLKKREMYQITSTINNKKNDIETLNKQIASSKENLTKAEHHKRERMRNLETYQTKLKDLDSHLETVKNDLFQIRGDLVHKESEETNLKDEILQIDSSLANEKNNLKALNAESSNRLLLYGRQMPKIKQLIAQHKQQFKHEPRGPLGMYIKIKDKKWTVAVEGYIGAGTLCAFAVDNKQDNNLLRQIFNQTLGNESHPQIITSKFIFTKHDVSRSLVQEPRGCVSVYNALEIKDPVVSNCIVDSCNPENALLIPSDSMAQELLSDVKNVPKKCYRGITVKGDRYFPDPNYRSYASSYHRAQYIQIDTKEHMRELQQNIEKLTNKRQVIINQLQEFKKNYREQMQSKQQLDEKIKKGNQDRAQIRRQIEELNSTEEPDFGNVQFLEQELEETKRTLNEKTAQLTQISEEIKEMKQLVVEKEQKMAQLKGSTRELEERIQNITKEIRENQLKYKEISTSDDFEKKRISEFEQRVDVVKLELVQKQKEVAKATLEASGTGERPTEIREVPTISNEIKELNLKITGIETDTEDVTELVDKYKELSEKYRNSSEIIENLKTDLNELTTAVDNRNKYYIHTENYFVTYLKHYFKKVLSCRQFEGSIDIDLENKLLDLIVNPQHGSQGHTSTTNLSGGERSFSTVAFLLSLWQCVDLPFYFLDEFDVYMDKQNRTKVIDILLRHAKSKPNLQFVFLTPQDVSYIEDTSLSILRLEDPERFTQ